jgi:hypothetical protein
MKYKALILVLFVLLIQPAYSQSKSDSDKDGIPDISDRFPLDYDNDGMPDSWEKTHGLRWDINDARLDRDNDGVTNLQEYENSLVVEEGLSDKIKKVPTETILWSVLAIGIILIIIGIIGMVIGRKRRAQIQYQRGVLNVRQ